MILFPERVTTLKIYYWMPDYENIIQLFMWQFDDIPPEFKNAHRFLNHWHNNIDAVISEVFLAYSGKYKQVEFNPVDDIFKIH